MSYRNDHAAALARLDALELALDSERRRTAAHAARLANSERERLRLIGELARIPRAEPEAAPPSRLTPRTPRPARAFAGYGAWIGASLVLAGGAYVAICVALQG